MGNNQNDGREEVRIARMGEKDHEKADTFVTLKCCTNVVSENNIFNVFL